MGDDCNVVSPRSEDSPTLRARIVGDIPVERERDFFLLDGRSGEYGKEMYKISGKKHVVRNDLPDERDESTEEPLLVVPPSLGKSKISPFPYSETKLRPDAPPFTPESLTRSGPTSRRFIESNDTVYCLEPSFVPRTIVDDSCFVNIELQRSSVENESSPSVINDQPGTLARDFTESSVIAEPELKAIDLTSTPRLERSLPGKIETSIDSVRANTENDGMSLVVATEFAQNELSNASVTRPETAEPPIVRGHWRILRTTFILSNRIQIVVFIASLVICSILVIYVVV